MYSTPSDPVSKTTKKEQQASRSAQPGKTSCWIGGATCGSVPDFMFLLNLSALFICDTPGSQLPIIAVFSKSLPSDPMGFLHRLPVHAPLTPQPEHRQPRLNERGCFWLGGHPALAGVAEEQIDQVGYRQDACGRGYHIFL